MTVSESVDHGAAGFHQVVTDSCHLGTRAWRVKRKKNSHSSEGQRERERKRVRVCMRGSEGGRESEREMNHNTDVELKIPSAC